jgi:hypothetical protein
VQKLGDGMDGIIALESPFHTTVEENKNPMEDLTIGSKMSYPNGDCVIVMMNVLFSKWV